MSTKLWFITLRAREDPACTFTSLAHLLTADFLKECFWELKRGKAPGIDGVTWSEYEANVDENITDLVARLKARQYRPQPVKRVSIPKPNGDRRPLGIPAIEGKIVQLAIKKILEAIFEHDFFEVSYGFRPNRSCHDALDMIDETIMTQPVNYVVDMDIAKFFDTVDHKWLIQYGDEARAFGRALEKRLAKFGLTISEEKSRIIAFGRYACQRARKQGKKCATFDFLGFTLYCDKTRNGNVNAGRKTSSKTFGQKMKEMNLWLKGIRNRVALTVWWQVLTQKLIGHYQYYGVSGNIRGLKRFYYYSVRLAFTWVNRRSQKRSYNWEQFNRFLLFNPLPKPKIYHFYTLSKRRGCAPEEPDEGKLHVRFCEGAHSSLGAITPLGGVL